MPRLMMESLAGIRRHPGIGARSTPPEENSRSADWRLGSRLGIHEEIQAIQSIIRVRRCGNR